MPWRRTYSTIERTGNRVPSMMGSPPWTPGLWVTYGCLMSAALRLTPRIVPPRARRAPIGGRSGHGRPLRRSRWVPRATLQSGRAGWEGRAVGHEALAEGADGVGRHALRLLHRVPLRD